MSNNNKTPAIRFKGFTDTWEQREFDKVFLSFPNKNYQLQSTEYYESGKFPIIDQGKKAIIGYSDNKSKVCNKYPSIIFGDHTTELKYVDFPFIIGADGVKTLSVKDGDTLFQYYNLQVNNVQPTGYNRHFSMLKEISLCVPCLAEQRQIGAYFRNLDTLITLHQRKCDKLIQFKAAMLKKMFPQNGANKPEIRFKGFTDAWEQRELEEVITVGNGMDYKHLSEGGIPVYGTGGYMLSVDKALSYDKDAIGIGRKGTIDKPYILKAPFWTVDTLFYCIPKEDYSLDFVYCIFQNVNWKEKDESTGVPSLSKVNINSTDVKVPTLAEQEKIGAYFEHLDSLITLHQRKCDKYKSIKAGLIRKLFP